MLLHCIPLVILVLFSLLIYVGPLQNPLSSVNGGLIFPTFGGLKFLTFI